MRKLLLIMSLLMFTQMPAYAWQEGIDLSDNGTWKKQTIRIKDLETGETKKIKYRIYGVNRDRIKVYTENGIKKYKIRK